MTIYSSDSYLSVMQLLSKPENCCGLKESEVLSLLNDVGESSVFLCVRVCVVACVCVYICGFFHSDSSFI